MVKLMVKLMVNNGKSMVKLMVNLLLTWVNQWLIMVSGYWFMVMIMVNGDHETFMGNNC